MKNNFRVGDIVISQYIDVSGTTNHGLFCVVYNEKDDVDTHTANNIVALKITSQQQPNYGYYHELPAGTGNLKGDSRVCCSKSYVLQDCNITGYIGSLPRTDVIQIMKKYKMFQFNVEKQFFDML